MAWLEELVAWELILHTFSNLRERLEREILVERKDSERGRRKMRRIAISEREKTMEAEGKVSRVNFQLLDKAWSGLDDDLPR
ncbi:hypothetical protein Pyn_35086 [Prunus yedoensis var. nudiflora]|uniref:Uncharacterized protein n=1 Tax=Prunus yedoensis var. nudiflora TaxID=2094558 RepID=A0A314ZM33_PRUYE|nr:hypothetical protein Pyn_35086 [Prunus yedoensis var. nudiflora]